MAPYLMLKKPVLILASAFLCLAILQGTAVVSISLTENTLPFFCPFKTLTGIPCPGCGMTRAILSITKGDFQEALNYNPFSFFLIFAVAISIVPGKYMEKMLTGRDVAVNCFLIAVLVSVIVFWFIARFLPAI